MSSKITPCPLCGYDAPGPGCPHCGLEPKERSLAVRRSGFLGGVGSGLVAVPRGMWFLFKTRGVKRWLIPPFLLTATSLFLVLWGLFAWVTGALGDTLPENLELAPPDWSWLSNLSEQWEWFGATVGGITAAVEWLLNHFLGFFANRVTGLVFAILIGFAAYWYVFSIAYEAFAGPFLDEIQARLETKWFGYDPRSAIERPTDIPAERCFRLSLLVLVPFCAAVVVVFLSPLPWWTAVAILPVLILVAAAMDRRYLTWLAWIVRIEAGAVIVSLKATFVTAVILSVTWPLYFLFPPIGYFLFACICGFATSVSLLDIPCERRGWSLRQRLRFVRSNLLALTAFGIVSGLLLAIPFLGALLMVPSASIGGLWLLCRLDKANLSPRPGAGPALATESDPA